MEEQILMPKLNVTGGPSEKALEYAKTVLGETEEVKTRCLQQLKDMILGTDEMKTIRVSNDSASLDLRLGFVEKKGSRDQ